MRASIDAHAGTGRAQLAGGTAGTNRVRDLVTVALDAVADASADRTGPAPSGGPAAVAATLATVLGAGVPEHGVGATATVLGSGGVVPPRGVDATATVGILPEHGVGAAAAIDQLTRLLVTGSVDPAHPWCAAHLHCPPLAVAAAADLVASLLNPSMDSWDQAPVASELERELTGALAGLCFPAAPRPDAVITSGGTESNLIGLLLARERGGRQPVCGRNAHHSVARAAWLLGLPAPRVVDCAGGRMRPDHLASVLAGLDTPAIVVATAGTTDTGAIDPLPEIAAVARDAWLHVDAAYGGAAVFSHRLAPLLDGLALADSAALDLHKFGWQPIAAGVLATRDADLLAALDVRADYLNAGDDTDAGLPDLLGRSIRTSRRPDAFKIAVTLRALGRAGVAALVEHCCQVAGEIADAIERHPGLLLWGRPELSTLLFRPTGDRDPAAVRRRLLEDGTAVLGRATVDGQVWLKLTLLNPDATAADYQGLLELVAGT